MAEPEGVTSVTASTSRRPLPVIGLGFLALLGAAVASLAFLHPLWLERGAPGPVEAQGRVAFAAGFAGFTGVGLIVALCLEVVAAPWRAWRGAPFGRLCFRVILASLPVGILLLGVAWLRPELRSLLGRIITG